MDWGMGVGNGHCIGVWGSFMGTEYWVQGTIIGVG